MMSEKTNQESRVMCFTRLTTCAAIVAAILPASASAGWEKVATEQGKYIEIDRDSIVTSPNGEAMARGRIVLDKAIVDPRTSVAYRTIEIISRFDCNERTHATLKRSYYKEDGELLRQEEVKMAYDMPVRSGTPDDKLLREVCRPKPATASPSAAQTVEKVNEAASELRQLNETLIEKEVKKDVQRLSARAGAALAGRSGTAKKPAPAATPQTIAWAYEGDGGPDKWGKLKPEYASCASGTRQSPIDIRDGIAVDLEPLQFSYRPSSFRVVDNGKTLVVLTYGGNLGLLGKNYALSQIQFHRPAEMTLQGKSFDMDIQLVHRSDEGKLAVVTVLLEKGEENPVIQKVLNNLPLEKGSDVMPPAQSLDVEALLPSNRAYYTFMGSLTTPPCSEDVLWLVLKKPQHISAAQMAIFQRLYPPNARPVQPLSGRIIKESR